jgi:Tfp pilus assembly protein PilN
MKLPSIGKKDAEAAVDWNETHNFDRAIKPRPDLVPTDIKQARGFAATVRMTAFGVGAIVALACIGLATVGGAALSAKSDAASAAMQNGQLNSKIAALSDVERYSDDLASRKKDIQSTFTTALDYSALYDAVFDKLPSGVNLTSFDVAPGQKCPGGDPFNPKPSIGCITVQATAPNASAITGFSSAVTADKSGVLVDAYASDITNSGDSQSFKLTVNYTQAAYSTRYSDFGGEVSTTSPSETANLPTTTAPSDSTADGGSDQASTTTDDSASAQSGK